MVPKFAIVLLVFCSLDTSFGQRKITRNIALTANVKTGIHFDCPEEFGYYPHPDDCTQYYVCVFGGALLESCTGGLMYSHELQTCDWPRNVGCDGVEAVAATTATPSNSLSRQRDEQKTRFTPPPPPTPSAQVTSRGQPRQFHHNQQIIKQQQLYAETEESLPPAEEVENDRQQRFYRGQPSTIGQVQRDRDGLRHSNAIPYNTGRGEKIGVISFGIHQNQNQQVPAYRVEHVSVNPPQETASATVRTLYNTSQYNNAAYDPYYEDVDSVELYKDIDYSQHNNYNNPPQTSPSQSLRKSPTPSIQSTTSQDNIEVAPKRGNVAFIQNNYNTQDVYQQPNIQEYHEDNNYSNQDDDQNNYKQSNRQSLRKSRNKDNSIQVEAKRTTSNRIIAQISSITRKPTKLNIITPTADAPMFLSKKKTPSSSGSPNTAKETQTQVQPQPKLYTLLDNPSSNPKSSQLVLSSLSSKSPYRLDIPQTTTKIVDVIPNYSFSLPTAVIGKPAPFSLPKHLTSENPIRLSLVRNPSKSTDQVSRTGTITKNHNIHTKNTNEHSVIIPTTYSPPKFFLKAILSLGASPTLNFNYRNATKTVNLNHPDNIPQINTTYKVQKTLKTVRKFVNPHTVNSELPLDNSYQNNQDITESSEESLSAPSEHNTVSRPNYSPRESEYLGLSREVEPTEYIRPRFYESANNFDSSTNFERTTIKQTDKSWPKLEYTTDALVNRTVFVTPRSNLKFEYKSPVTVQFTSPPNYEDISDELFVEKVRHYIKLGQNTHDVAVNPKKFRTTVEIPPLDALLSARDQSNQKPEPDQPPSYKIKPFITTSTSTIKTTTKTDAPTSTSIPARISRVNTAIKTMIANGGMRRQTSKCNESTTSVSNCNELKPERTNTRGRGAGHFTSGNTITNEVTINSNRGTPPPRARPTLKPSTSIVSKAAEFIDVYRYPPRRPDPIYPQPQPDKTAAKCRKDVCLLPDCNCGGKEIPGDLPAEQLPQIVLLTFDDSVNDLNKGLYSDLFEKGRTNPNGCPISATFYVSHEWTDYGQVQNLYSDGHEIASHTVSHSFGEQFSQKKWTREIAGQREILAAYGGVHLEDVRGMRAPFLSVGGNKMFKMLYDSNFTYDSSMPIYENKPPSWPYTLDYKLFHDCMIPPCPTRSYPGVWEVPMVMWQDLNGGRCSMGDACSNPSDPEGVYKMIMKNFQRHYTTNRAPFGLFYHAAWFTQPHHKEGFIQFLDAILAIKDVWVITNWQAVQWVRDPTPTSRLGSFQPFQCNYSDRPKRCNNPKVCNLWHKSGVRYMRTCQPCPDIYPWTGNTGIRSSRIDNDIED